MRMSRSQQLFLSLISPFSHFLNLINFILCNKMPIIVAIFLARVIIASSGCNQKKIILLLNRFEIVDRKTKIHGHKNMPNVT